ncbi:hypothetical protein F5J12DRAFT_787528 [Pisolithus orientalis]|uniref:uncharacterized protein n=1 Tax=Pisolithus orientalis TaxID=936130 RepID=UPI002224C1D3|nr:uncharacterized protein F5J12DRAFT_787528 [Pisolithus orientalis]KAI5984806.1 hypothetical protein F5J12DRAFT_787528 [Pisolithus orientalis]
MSAEQSCQVHFCCQANVRPIKPRQSSSHVKQSKNLEETLVQLHELQEPTPPPIVSSGRADMVGLNMDIMANSCESFLDQFLQEREPTALAEGGIVAVIDPHDNLMNRFLNEWEPTAPPVDGMNMDLLEQLLNMQEPSALPVTHKKLNRMDGSSTPAQDVTMQVNFPSAQQSLQMEQWGLAPVPHCDQVLCTLQAAVSCYCRITTPSDTLFNPTPDRHLVWAVNAIVRELGTAARDQYGAASQGL